MPVVGERQGIERFPKVVHGLVNQIENACEMNNIAFLKKPQSVTIRATKKTNEFFMVLGLMLTKIANLSGLKGDISEVNKTDIEDLIISFYSFLSLDEIFYAFKLERYNQYQEKSKHYEMFGAEYVSEVLKKYTNWKSNAKKQYNIPLPKHEPEEKELTKEEKEVIVAKGVERMYQEFKNGKEIPTSCVYIYNYLRKKGVIKPHSPSYKEEKRKKAVKNIKVQNSIINDVMSLRKQPTKEKIEDECKRLALIDHFQKRLESESSKKT